MYHTVILYLLLSYVNVFQSATVPANRADVLCGTVADGTCTQQAAKLSTCSDGTTQYGAGVDGNCYYQYNSNDELVCVNELSAAICPVEGDPCSGCHTMGAPNILCPDKINSEGPIGCTWQKDGNVLFCADKYVKCPCTTNDDCFSGEWCRETCDDATVKQCAPYAIEGGNCGGYTMLCMVEQCAPEMSCVDMYPNIVDEPGTCTVLCEIDDDCDSGQWCRAILNEENTCNTEKQCVSYAADGDSCGGKVMPCYLEMCAPGMTCLDLDPAIVDEPGVCGPDTVSCRIDDDCGSDEWCQETCDDSTIKQCVPYAIEGGYCGGFTPSCNELRCVPEMSCVDMYPTMMDEPGRCTVLCETDDDCNSQQWCREILNEEDTCNTEKGCVSFAAQGEHCGGMVMPCDEEMCAAGMTCLDTFICGEETVLVSCSIDDDCGSDEWCRVTCDDTTIKQCVPYAAKGDSCGGFTLACAFEKCVPEITCLDTDPMICGEETVSVSCVTDDDCESDEWCRAILNDDNTCDTGQECVSFAGAGDSCGGYVMACYLEICGYGMACLDKNPMIADLPGVCCQDGYTVTEDGECVQLVDEDCDVFGLEPAQVKETICSVCFRERDEVSIDATSDRGSKRVCKAIERIRNNKAELSEGTKQQADCMLKFCKTQNQDLINCDLEFVVLRDDIRTIDDASGELYLSEEDCNCDAFVCDDQQRSNSGNLGIFIGFGVVFAIFGWM